MLTRRKFTKLCSASLLATKGKPDLSKIKGRIQWVESFPDYKVKEVSAFEDMSVQIVTHSATRPGQWQIVKNFPDFKLKRVKHFPDFTVKYVKHFPGPRR